MSKEQRHSEIIERLATLEEGLKEIIRILQHPERSAFGPSNSELAQAPHVQPQGNFLAPAKQEREPDFHPANKRQPLAAE